MKPWLCSSSSHSHIVLAMTTPSSSSAAAQLKPPEQSQKADLTREDILADLALLGSSGDASSSQDRHALLALGRSLSSKEGDDTTHDGQSEQDKLLQAFLNAAPQNEQSSSSRTIESLHARVAKLQAQMDAEQRDLDVAKSMLDGQ